MGALLVYEEKEYMVELILTQWPLFLLYEQNGAPT
jgi:hypothetical protein